MTPNEQQKQNVEPQTSTGRLSKSLRWLGAASLVMSAVVFMLQGINALSSFERFLSFGVVSAGLGILGLFAGTKVKETKSARTFLGLAAAATPVLFSQVGAMIHSLLNPGTASSIPSAFLVTAPSAGAAAISTALALIIMTPILYIGFSVFFRDRAQDLVLLMIIGSALLLAPWRTPLSTTVLVLFETFVLSTYAARRMRARHATNDFDSLVAGLLPTIPVMIMIGRSLFYGFSGEMFGSIALFFASLLLVMIPALWVSARQHAGFETPGILLAVCAWLGFTHEIHNLAEAGFMFTLFPAAVLILLTPSSFRKRNVALAPFATIALYFSLFATVVSHWSPSVALTLVIMGSAAAVLGFTQRQSLAFTSGLVTSSFGAAYFVLQSARLFVSMPWVSLAGLGVIVILLAAWLEKNQSKLAGLKSRFDAHFQSPRSAQGSVENVSTFVSKIQ